ncbi:30S ribosome-binding factor RbfA [Buchnera aphidicola (Ceratoglyphina bambusae)]|uniref:30S ribosome-binding factor RbfA n=1 Tax=Buchnera aphidicola TaxID=9 RepID=UPI0031B8AEF4
MILEFNRSVRVSSIIRKEISNILYYSINDHRIKFFITILDVKISKDLKYAKVYFTVLNTLNKNNIFNIIKIFNSYKKYIRKLLSKKINLRVVPELFFSYDDSFPNGIKISNLLKKENIK